MVTSCFELQKYHYIAHFPHTSKVMWARRIHPYYANYSTSFYHISWRDRLVRFHLAHIGLHTRDYQLYD